MRVLVTGAAGQLGQAVLETFPPDHDVHPTYHQDVPSDLPDGPTMPVEDRNRVAEVVAEADPDAVLHAAALSDVDACEEDPQRAEAVNVDGTAHLARAAAEADAAFLLVSTDYVFAGTKGDHSESDPVDPVNVYGRTKAQAEDEARAHHPAPVVARPSVVYGPHEPNFVTWVVDELRAGNEVPLVTDQRVTPTYTPDLAAQLQALLEADARGTYHTAGATSLTRHAMGERIAAAFDLDADLVTTARLEDLPWEAPRPKDTSLRTRKIRELQPPWPLDEALADLRKRLET